VLRYLNGCGALRKRQLVGLGYVIRQYTSREELELRLFGLGHFGGLAKKVQQEGSICVLKDSKNETKYKSG